MGGTGRCNKCNRKINEAGSRGAQVLRHEVSGEIEGTGNMVLGGEMGRMDVGKGTGAMKDQ